MTFYNKRDSYGKYNSYSSDTRRSSNSFNEEQSGAKRKRPNWPRSRGGSNGPNRSSPAVNSRGSPRQFTRKEQLEVGSRQVFNMPPFVEPQHSGPSWHWDIYSRDCKAWQDKHKLAYYRSRCMALEFENQMLFEQINSLIEENCVIAAERGEMPSMRVPEMPDSQPTADPRAQTTLKKQGKNKKASNTSDTEIECEVTEDMMKCIETSMRHRLNLKKKKSEESAKEKSEQEKIKKEEDSKKKMGPKVPMGLLRKKELEQLYGVNSAAIHALETSVELNFNRNCDTCKPEMWMAVPLNAETITA